MRQLLGLIIISLFSLNSFAQSFDLPSDVKLETKKDYKKYEQDVLNAIEWYHSTPLPEQATKRKEVTAFLFKWMSGSPTVSIELSEGLVPFMECSQCLLSFMNGWTKYCLTNNYSKDKKTCASAAINQSIEFYQKNKKELGKIASLEKLIKKKEKGELDQFIKSEL